MEQNFSRFAVYWRPEPGPLADFGAAWLGWDPATGTCVDHPAMDLDVATITQTPRKYGLHGTIKPPIRLADGTTADALRDAFDALCAGLAPVQMDGLELSRLGGFLALTPQGDPTDLAALAGAAVRGLDAFRAPTPEAELARRRKAGLTPAQERNLMDWGYPYVMDEFRFHVTLTGKLTPEQAQTTADAIAPVIGPLCPRPFAVTSLTLLGEDDAGRFHDIHRAALGG